MPELTPDQRKSRLAAVARDLGFDVFGVAKATSRDPEDRAHLFEWLTKGYHASMDWMARDPQQRTDVQCVLPGASSVVSLAINYYSPRVPDDSCGSLKVSRYAWGEDYHRVLDGKLKKLCAALAEFAPEAKSLAYCDTGPLLEKSWAQRAGVGWIGKNSNLLTRGLGSWVFLAEIVTTAELAPDTPHNDFCGSCTRCIDACPTEAIVEPYVVDSNKCISYWTIEHRGGFPEGLSENFDGWIFGCDICQEVCPWNRFAKPSREAAFEPRCDCVCPPEERWGKLSPAEFREAFADSPIQRARHEGLARNIRSQGHNPLRAVLKSVAWEQPSGLDHITVDGLGISDSPEPPKTP